jgi:hypothetical protein
MDSRTETATTEREKISERERERAGEGDEKGKIESGALDGEMICAKREEGEGM